MKLLIRMSLLLILAGGMFTSCKKASPKQTKHIPKNALMVAAINTGALEDKLVKSQATLDNIFDAISKNDTSMAEGKKKWEELKNAGIDFSDNFYVAVVQKDGSLVGGKGTAVMSAFGTLKDASKLEAYIKKEKPGTEIIKEKNYSYATTEGSKMVAWGDDMVIMMGYEKPGANRMQYDSATGEYSFQAPVQDASELKAEMASYFNMKEEESVASVPEFRDLMQENGDARFWFNSSSSMDNVPIPLPKLKELFGNSFTTAILNFEDGKIVVDSKSYISPEMRDMLKKYSGPAVDLSLVENYPSQNINGFMSMAFNPELFGAIIKYMEVGGVVDGFLTDMMGSNYTYNDVIKILKGDIAMVMSDFQMPASNDMGMMESKGAPFKFLLNLPVGDAKQMTRLMDKLAERQLIVKANNQYRLNPSMEKAGAILSADDKNIIIASSEELVSQYKSKSGKANLGDATKELSGKSLAFYVNIESILNGISIDTSSKEMTVILPKAKETFRDIKAYTDQFNGKYTEGHAEFRMKNEKQNSLTSLVEFMGVAAQTAQKAKAERAAMMKEWDMTPADTSSVPVE